MLAVSATISAQETQTSLSGGIWYNFSYLNESNDSQIGDEALVIYASGKGKGHVDWSFGGEFRIGPGGFSDEENNSTGGKYTVHEAWLAIHPDEYSSVSFGKVQVPFSWKTLNFWPGDMFQAAYGDQMDVGFMYQRQEQQLKYALSYFVSDDWGSTSTDSTDDNRHWGSSKTYRKVDTFVADAKYELKQGQQIGLSWQKGKLEELMTGEKQTDGEHSAWVVYYLGSFGNKGIKLQYIDGERELPQSYYQTASVEPVIENTRAGVELTYEQDNWLYVFDATWAFSDTANNTVDTISAYAPGVRYNYGPGWVYLEYLWQDGWIDRDMKIHEGKFSAWYFTVDFYF